MLLHIAVMWGRPSSTVCSFRVDCRHSGGTYYLNLHLVSWGWRQYVLPEIW